MNEDDRAQHGLPGSDGVVLAVATVVSVVRFLVFAKVLLHCDLHSGQVEGTV